MVNRLNAVLCGFIALVLLGLTGCGPIAATRPVVISEPPLEPKPPPAGKQRTIGTQTIEETTPPEETTAPSSLEALRRGEAPITPRESALKDIYFDFDHYDLQSEARATLKANAEWLEANPMVRVVIEGHADERGTNEYNLALGAERAQAAEDYLISLGISRDRLSTISYGEEVPVCREHNEACWWRNRRDRFVARVEKPGV